MCFYEKICNKCGSHPFANLSGVYSNALFADCSRSVAGVSASRPVTGAEVHGADLQVTVVDAVVENGKPDELRHVGLVLRRIFGCAQSMRELFIARIYLLVESLEHFGKLLDIDEVIEHRHVHPHLREGGPPLQFLSGCTHVSSNILQDFHRPVSGLQSLAEAWEDKIHHMLNFFKNKIVLYCCKRSF